ncbi:enoyl-CoA hydratase/isomerase family protein [Natrinema sp. H-ect4]|uniref:enoyl-CoA hydratase/isomerase family protein n=1 Tax=Natrinema sp. H-ect4 TaxID=3242699 RepID=UPI0035A93F84
MTDEPVLLDVTDGAARVELNRPDKYNALNDALVERLSAVLETVERDPDVRCVVLSGAGGAFCAGGDIGRMKGRRERNVTPPEMRREVLYQVRDTVERVFSLEKPVIVKVDGVAMGGGANLALAGDLVFAATDATFGEVFKNVGLSVDFGGSFLLPQLVGLHKAKELVFSGEPISGEEAADIGLINDAVPPGDLGDLVDEWVSDLSSAPTEALALAKRDLNAGATADFATAIRNEATSQGLLQSTRDHREGVDAFFEDRDPEFHGE